MIALTSLKTSSLLYNPKIFGKYTALPTFQKRDSSSSSYNEKKQRIAESTTQGKRKENPSFMPVVNIPVAELAHSAFFSMHRPLLGLSTPRPFLAGDMVGQIKNEECQTEQAMLQQYMMGLRPFEPPGLDAANKEEKCSTTTLTVEVDPSYFLNHINNHDDYLTAMQEKLDLLYDEKTNRTLGTNSTLKKKTRRLRKRKGFFEKN